MTLGGITLDARAAQFVWFVGGAALGFLIPYVFSSLLGLQHDLYYGIYFALVGLFLTAYVRTTGVSVRDTFTRSLPLTLVLGLIIAGLEVMNILRTSPVTAHPAGAYFGFELVWRGVLYGAVDALLLTAFPAMVAFGLMGGDLHSIMRHIGFAAMALVLTIVITGTYHWGYRQYRQDGLQAPEQGNIIMTLPTLISGNPVGTIIAHATMHVTANVRSYETPVYLPPAIPAK
jgi:hypothetical protein